MSAPYKEAYAADKSKRIISPTTTSLPAARLGATLPTPITAATSQRNRRGHTTQRRMASTATPTTQRQGFSNRPGKRREQYRHLQTSPVSNNLGVHLRLPVMVLPITNLEFLANCIAALGSHKIRRVRTDVLLEAPLTRKPHLIVTTLPQPHEAAKPSGDAFDHVCARLSQTCDRMDMGCQR